MDPDTVAGIATRLELRPEDPPVYLEITPPFSERWVRRLESVGAVPITDGLRERLRGASEAEGRMLGWRTAKECAARARSEGFAGVVLMGLRFETVVGEAYEVWNTSG